MYQILPPHQKFPIEGDSPTVHTPRKKRAVPNIESDKEVEASPGHVGKTGSKTGSEEPVSTAPQGLPDSLSLRDSVQDLIRDQVLHIER